MPMQIHGKTYVMVHERVREFHEKYPNGMIQSKVISHENASIVVQAIVIPDAKEPTRAFTGLACEGQSDSDLNSTSYVEVAETSAVGRALGFLGIGIETAIASADEVDRAIENSPGYQKEKKVALRKIEDWTVDQILAYELEFGKYKGMRLDQAIGDTKFLDYLNWIVEQTPKDERGMKVKRIIERFLEHLIELE